MGKGRKATPSKILNLRGGTKHTHKKPRSDQEPMPPEKVPSCPEILDEIAKKEWHRMADLLGNVRLMTEMDMATLAIYAQSYSDWWHAVEGIREKGFVWVNKLGEPRINPWKRVIKEAEDRLMKNAVLLGAGGASSRVNLKVEKPRKENKAQKFMARKNGG